MDHGAPNWKRTFLTIWSGQAVSLLGSAAVQFAIIWWLTIQTGSASVLAMASLAGFLPQALIGPFAGVWVDRLSRKTVMIAADLFIAAAGGVLAIAFLLGTPATWFVYTILFLRAVGSVFHVPAMQASIPMFVPESELGKTAGWSQFVQSGSLLAGPVLGAVLMAAFSIPVVMLVDVLGALVAVAALVAARIPDPARGTGGQQHVLREMLDGLRVIGDSRALRAITAPVVLCVFIWVPVGTLFPLMVNGHFGGTAWHAGLVESVYAGGLLASSLLLGIWGGMKDKPAMISLALCALGVTLVISGLLPAGAFAAFAALTLVMGFLGNCFSVAYISLVQATVPPASLGRAFALFSGLASLTTPLGLAVVGPLAEALGVAPWFTISGLLLLLTGALGYGLSRGVARAEASERAAGQAPAQQEG